MSSLAHRAHAAFDRLAALRTGIAQRWEALPPAWRTSRRLCTAGFGLALMLLWCFYAVVDDAVDRGAATLAPLTAPQAIVDRASGHDAPA